MSDLFTWGNITTLLMLILLQAVLGFDNLLYISLESKKAPPEKQQFSRRLGISLAIALRIGLLFLLVSLIGLFQDTLFSINYKDWIQSKFTGHSLIVLFGGGFIIYTAIKEIWHMISHENLDEEKGAQGSKRSAGRVITMIVVMNVVFSFDSVLSAIALTSDIGQHWVEMTLMCVAIVVSGILMIVLADRVSRFLAKNRMYEVLGLFILFIVGIMLLTEGGHLAHIKLFGEEIVPMSKTTFYFVIVILVLIDIIQSRYQKKIIKLEQAEEMNGSKTE